MRVYKAMNPAMISKPWTDDEARTLMDLYESGDKAPLPWRQIVERLNEEFSNNRTLAACQRRLYSDAKKWRAQITTRGGQP